MVACIMVAEYLYETAQLNLAKELRSHEYTFCPLTIYLRPFSSCMESAFAFKSSLSGLERHE